MKPSIYSQWECIDIQKQQERTQFLKCILRTRTVTKYTKIHTPGSLSISATQVCPPHHGHGSTQQTAIWSWREDMDLKWHCMVMFGRTPGWLMVTDHGFHTITRHSPSALLSTCWSQRSFCGGTSPIADPRSSLGLLWPSCCPSWLLENDQNRPIMTPAKKYSSTINKKSHA